MSSRLHVVVLDEARRPLHGVIVWQRVRRSMSEHAVELRRTLDRRGDDGPRGRLIRFERRHDVPPAR